MFTCTSLFIFCRLQLAALHFNENSSRKQAVTRKGEDRYDIIFPKYKKGGYVVRKVIQGPTYGRCFTCKFVINVHGLFQDTLMS